MFELFTKHLLDKMLHVHIVGLQKLSAECIHVYTLKSQNLYPINELAAVILNTNIKMQLYIICETNEIKILAK